jgi:hypothetical protein
MSSRVFGTLVMITLDWRDFKKRGVWRSRAPVGDRCPLEGSI